MIPRGPFTPLGMPPGQWGSLHQSCCAAVYRAITEHGEDPTGFMLRKDTPRLHERVRDAVQATNERRLGRILGRQIESYGYLPGGWSTRWPEPGVRMAWEPPPVPPDLVVELPSSPGESESDAKPLLRPGPAKKDDKKT